MRFNGLGPLLEMDIGRVWWGILFKDAPLPSNVSAQGFPKWTSGRGIPFKGRASATFRPLPGMELRYGGSSRLHPAGWGGGGTLFKGRRSVTSRNVLGMRGGGGIRFKGPKPPDMDFEGVSGLKARNLPKWTADGGGVSGLRTREPPHPTWTSYRGVGGDSGLEGGPPPSKNAQVQGNTIHIYIYIFFFFSGTCWATLARRLFSVRGVACRLRSPAQPAWSRCRSTAPVYPNRSERVAGRFFFWF